MRILFTFVSLYIVENFNFNIFSTSPIVLTRNKYVYMIVYINNYKNLLLLKFDVYLNSVVPYFVTILEIIKQ